MSDTLLSEPDLGQVDAVIEKVIGRPVDRHTAWSWWRRGRRGHTLETMLIGGRRMTTPAAVRRFLEALNKVGPRKLRA